MTMDLYNRRIVEAAKRARERGRLADADVSVTRDNPLCGDRITLDLRFEGERIAALGLRVRGCLLTEAAATLLAERGVGATPRELWRAQEDLRRLLAGEAGEPVWPELAMFRPVAAVKSRHECVLLPFEAAAEALARGRAERA